MVRESMKTKIWEMEEVEDSDETCVVWLSYIPYNENLFVIKVCYYSIYRDKILQTRLSKYMEIYK